MEPQTGGDPPTFCGSALQVTSQALHTSQRSEAHGIITICRPGFSLRCILGQVLEEVLEESEGVYGRAVDLCLHLDLRKVNPIPKNDSAWRLVAEGTHASTRTYYFLAGEFSSGGEITSRGPQPQHGMALKSVSCSHT